jgi:hypothetical protein
VTVAIRRVVSHDEALKKPHKALVVSFSRTLAFRRRFVLSSILMRSRSFLSLAAWFYLGPVVAIAALALLVLGVGALAITMQLIAALLKHATR